MWSKHQDLSQKASLQDSGFPNYMNISIVGFFHTSYHIVKMPANCARLRSDWPKSTQCYRPSSPISLEVGIWSRPLVPLWKYSKEKFSQMTCGRTLMSPNQIVWLHLDLTHRWKAQKMCREQADSHFLSKLRWFCTFQNFGGIENSPEHLRCEKDLWLTVPLRGMSSTRFLTGKKRSPLGSPKYHKLLMTQ